MTLTISAVTGKLLPVLFFFVFFCIFFSPPGVLYVLAKDSMTSLPLLEYLRRHTCHRKYDITVTSGSTYDIIAVLQAPCTGALGGGGVDHPLRGKKAPAPYGVVPWGKGRFLGG